MSIASPKMSKSDREWEAENDARTLADAEAIKVDNTRLKRAQKAAKRMANEAQTKAAAMSFVSKGKMNPALRVRNAKG